MDIFTFIVALLVLFYSGGVIVRSLTWIGRYFEMSEYALSLILVAFATSIPELFVGINSAMTDAQHLSLGDLIGANVLNVTLVIGIAILFAGKKLEFSRPAQKKDLSITAALIVLPIFLISDGAISRSDGFVLLLAFIVYVAHVIKGERISPTVDEFGVNDLTFSIFLKKIIYFVLGTILLIFSAYILVNTAKSVAISHEVPLFALGLLVALGTTLPEVVFSVRSVFLGHSSMSIGNALGSVIFNIVFILGLVALLNPFTISNPNSLIGPLILPLFFIFLIQAVGMAKGHFSRTFGLFLILISFVFILVEGGFW